MFGGAVGLLCEDLQYCGFQKLCLCVSVRWCFIELVSCKESFWVGNQNFTTRLIQSLETLHQFTNAFVMNE